jgi:hypothetical protein
MGIVYRAEDTRLRRTVAIKVLHDHIAADPALQARLLTEAQAVARIEHDNVVTVHAVEEGDGTPYLVMQHVRGGPLSNRVEDGPLDVSEVLRIGSELAAGLAAAHGQGVVHRDLKPANILLDGESGRALISDFGLARVLDQPGQTRSGIVAGTPEFMAPEQALGLTVGPTADLFALGAVLYYTLTGISPFRSDNAMVCLRLVCEHTPVEIDSIRSDVPKWLSDAVGKLLAKAPKDRFSSADELLAILRQHATGSEVGLTSGSKSAGTSPWKRFQWIAVPLCLIATAVIIGGWVRGRLASPTAPITSPKQTAVELASQTEQAQEEGQETFPPGFVVRGGRHFLSLRAAVEAAPAGGEIAVFGTGRLECDPIAIEGKSLTIRAASGQQPLLVPATGPGDQPLIRTDDNLVIEGLTIEWSVAASDGESADRPGRAAIVAGGDQLSVTNCRFELGTGTAGLEFGGRLARVQRSEFLGPEGHGIRWTSDALSELSVSHCHLATRTAILAHLYRDGFELSIGTLTLSRNELSGGRGIQFFGNRGPKRRIVVSAEENVFFLQHLVLLEGQLGTPRLRGAPEQALRMVFKWSHDRRNIYSSSITFLAFQGPQRVRPMPMAETLPDWLDLWQFRGSDSLSQSTTDEIPNEVGPDRSILGPGAPFDAWRNSSARR